MNAQTIDATAHLDAAACDGRQHEADTALHGGGGGGGGFGRCNWLRFLLGDRCASSLLLRLLLDGRGLRNWGTRVHGGFDRL